MELNSSSCLELALALALGVHLLRVGVGRLLGALRSELRRPDGRHELRLVERTIEAYTHTSRLGIIDGVATRC